MEKAEKAKFIATFFKVGYLPKMPGTWGSLAALPLVAGLIFLLQSLPWPAGAAAYLAVAVVLFYKGLVSVQRAGPQMLFEQGKRQYFDHPKFVIDEVLGMAVSAFPLLFTPVLSGRFWYGLLAAFILFRIFDILKPWPIRLIDRRDLPFNVMADDSVAGLFAAVVTAVVAYLL